jgi:two-component system heavy metal sensor histidine kinase CusS
MRPSSLTARLTLYFALASTAVLLGIGSLVGARVQAHFVEQDQEEMRGKLELVRHILSQLRSPAELQTVSERLADALVGHEHLAVAVVAAPRRELFRTSGAVFPDALLRVPPVERSQPVEWEQHGHAYRGISGSATRGVAGEGPVTVAIAVDIAHHRTFMSALTANLWLALACGVAASALLGWFAAHGGLLPLRRLTQTMRGISAGRLAERLPIEPMPAELVELGQAFNQMLARLQDSFDRLSHFSSDLAHELRTPISNLMLQTQVAASKARSAEEYREVLYSNVEEHERLARMVGDMLFLAQADNGLKMSADEPVDLAGEVRALFGFYEALAEEAGVGLELHGGGWIDGDRLMIRRALSNLLANAIYHTPRGATVQVGLSARAGGGLRLQVRNPGTIAPEHLPRLFDRFYRVDPARREAPAGAGLGLAITQSIVAAHGGTIIAESQSGEVCFTLDLPAREPQGAGWPGGTPSGCR